ALAPRGWLLGQWPRLADYVRRRRLSAGRPPPERANVGFAPRAVDPAQARGGGGRDPGGSTTSHRGRASRTSSPPLALQLRAHAGGVARPPSNTDSWWSVRLPRS